MRRKKPSRSRPIRIDADPDQICAFIIIITIIRRYKSGIMTADLSSGWGREAD